MSRLVRDYGAVPTKGQDGKDYFKITANAIEVITSGHHDNGEISARLVFQGPKGYGILSFSKNFMKQAVNQQVDQSLLKIVKEGQSKDKLLIEDYKAKGVYALYDNRDQGDAKIVNSVNVSQGGHGQAFYGNEAPGRYTIFRRVELYVTGRGAIMFAFIQNGAETVLETAKAKEYINDARSHLGLALTRDAGRDAQREAKALRDEKTPSAGGVKVERLSGVDIMQFKRMGKHSNGNDRVAIKIAKGVNQKELPLSQKVKFQDEREKWKAIRPVQTSDGTEVSVSTVTLILTPRGAIHDFELEGKKTMPIEEFKLLGGVISQPKATALKVSEKAEEPKDSVKEATPGKATDSTTRTLKGYIVAGADNKVLVTTYNFAKTAILVHEDAEGLFDEFVHNWENERTRQPYDRNAAGCAIGTTFNTSTPVTITVDGEKIVDVKPFDKGMKLSLATVFREDHLMATTYEEGIAKALRVVGIRDKVFRGNEPAMIKW